MKRYTPARYLAITLVLVGLVLAPWALAAPTGGQVTAGPQERGSDSTAQTVTTEGGNVTNVNVTGTQITARWAGFFGSVGGGIQLTDSSSNIFYQWTVTNFTDAVVYAANGSVSNFATVAAGSNSTAPDFLHTSATDNYNNTYSSQETFTSASLSIANTYYTTTYQGGSAGTIRSYSLVDSSGTVHIWAGKVIDNTTAFNSGDDIDYQILAPADSNGLVYTFYLELP